MRRVVFALVIFLVCASAGVRVHASTECERWIAEYRDALAHSNAVKRANAARHRLHRYVHRKIAALTKPKAAPKPHVLPARHRRPPMSREEMLRKFELACGELPEDAPAVGSLPKDPLPVFIADRKPGDDDLSLDTDTPSTLLALNQLPSYVGGGVGLPGGGYGPAPYLPGFGGLPPGGAGGHNQTPTATPVTQTGGDNPPPPPPTAQAPEPDSLVLMATGLAGVAGAIRRRRQAA